MIYALASIPILMVVLTFLLPIIRPAVGLMSHAESALAILHDQMKEIDRDIGRGLISAEDGHSARSEIQRRIIAVDRQRLPISGSAITGAVALIAASVLVPLAAAALYLNIGAPTIPSATFAQRGDERAEIARQEDLTQQLLGRLMADRNGGATKGWSLLADAYMQLEQYANAANTLARVLDRSDISYAEFTRYAEALILLENGVVTPAAERALNRSLELAPMNPGGIYYKLFALEQSGQVDAAYSLLTSRLSAADGYRAWMEAYVEQANLYGRKLGKAPIAVSEFASGGNGPTTEEIAGASDMSEEERTAYVASMVKRLAVRLEEEPDDLAGWLRLARSYTVLGDEAKAIAAYTQAAPLVAELPDTDPRKELVHQNLEKSQ